MGLTVGLDDGRTACAESIESFVRAVDAFSEYHLLDASRCHGWTRLDVAVHVLAGWQEMLGGLVSVRDSDPTVDAATYWSAFATESATALMRGVTACEDRRYLWQGHVFTAGDFLTVWAVEVVVHQIDLLSDEPAPSSALRLARATIEALIDEPVPTAWTDLDATLIGTGRAPVPVGSGIIAAQFPAFS